MGLKQLITDQARKIIHLCCKLPFGYQLAPVAIRLGYRFLGVKSRKMLLYGLRFHYLEAGRGPHLVLIHGLGGSCLAWSFNLGPLSGSFHVIAPDLIGFGFSDKPLISYRIATVTEYLHDLLSELKLNKVILVGNSLGGWVAGHFTLTYPEMVEKLVLVDSAGYAPEHALSDRERSLLNAVTLSHVKIYAQRIFFRQQFVDEPELKIRLRNKITSPEPYVTDRFLDSIEKRQDVLDFRLSGIKVPTLIIWGREDQVIPVEDAMRFHREIADSKLVIFDQCGHVPQVEYAEKFNQEILRFLAPHKGETLA